MKCPQCGETIPDGLFFCSHCGALLSQGSASGTSVEAAHNEAKPIAEIPESNCATCGAPLKADSKYCSECGKPVAQADANSSAQPQAIPVAAGMAVVSDGSSAASGKVAFSQPTQSMPPQTDASTPSAAMSTVTPDFTKTTSDNPPDPRRKRIHQLTVIAVISVAIVVGLGIFGFIYSGQSASKSSSTPTSQTSAQKTESSQSDSASFQSSAPSSSSSDSAQSGSSQATSGSSSNSNVATQSSTQANAQISYSLHGSGETWTEAENYCQSRGGELACIKSQDDYDKILAMLSDSGYIAVYVGGYYDRSRAQWMWVDGTPFAYTDWAPGEPNNESGSEYYLTLLKAPQGWGWYDDPNDISDEYNPAKIGFVMETRS